MGRSEKKGARPTVDGREGHPLFSTKKALQGLHDQISKLLRVPGSDATITALLRRLDPVTPEERSLQVVLSFLSQVGGAEYYEFCFKSHASCLLLGSRVPRQIEICFHLPAGSITLDTAGDLVYSSQSDPPTAGAAAGPAPAVAAAPSVGALSAGATALRANPVAPTYAGVLRSGMTTAPPSAPPRAPRGGGRRGADRSAGRDSAVRVAARDAGRGYGLERTLTGTEMGSMLALVNSLEAAAVPAAAVPEAAVPAAAAPETAVPAAAVPAAAVPAAAVMPATVVMPATTRWADEE